MNQKDIFLQILDFLLRDRDARSIYQSSKVCKNWHLWTVQNRYKYLHTSEMIIYVWQTSPAVQKKRKKLLLEMLSALNFHLLFDALSVQQIYQFVPNPLLNHMMISTGILPQVYVLINKFLNGIAPLAIPHKLIEESLVNKNETLNKHYIRFYSKDLSKLPEPVKTTCLFNQVVFLVLLNSTVEQELLQYIQKHSLC